MKLKQLVMHPLILVIEFPVASQMLEKNSRKRSKQLKRRIMKPVTVSDSSWKKTRRSSNIILITTKKVLSVLNKSRSKFSSKLVL